ncbi:MAG: PIG-L family deacetylase [Acidobacteria bacterium]|nr:PIG-L family deacetylase [Acidobacteriota bacterium]
MHIHRFAAVVGAMLAIGAGGFGTAAHAQPLASGEGREALGVALRQLNSTGSFMSIVAHPDDENNALLARLSRGEGHRAVLLSATRGDGGQNEIGAELFDALAVLRTEELHAAHRLDGAEQYFTRAVDFGYSFSIEETFERWGREEILGDFVRMIRTIRPDVVSALPPGGRGGGQHHQASAVLAHEAWHAAADPDRFPEQIAEGLAPWQASKFYFRVGFPFGMGGGPPGFRSRSRPDPDVATVDLAGYDPLLGTTWAEIGSRARGMHKCQGTSQLVALPSGAAGGRYRLVETTIAEQSAAVETSLFDGVDTSITGLARFAGENPPGELVWTLELIGRYASDALRAFERGDGRFHMAAGGAARRSGPGHQPLIEGLEAVRDLRARLAGLGLSADARREIDFRLAAKERQFERAVLLDFAVSIDAFADDGVVTPGQSVEVTVRAANHGAGGGGSGVTVRDVSFLGFDGEAACESAPIGAGGVYVCDQQVRMPAAARTTDIHWSHVEGADRYALDPDVPFGLPFRPTPFRAVVEIELGGRARLAVERPVRYRYVDDVFTAEKRMDLQVAPRFAVSMTPDIAIIPTGSGAVREVRVTVTNTAPEAAEGSVTLDLPRGWSATPATVPVRFSREDESRTVRFSVEAGGAAAGEYSVSAAVVNGGERFERGYQVIEYPHIERRHLGRSASGSFKVIDVAIAPDLLVGYVEGVGDAVPPAIEQLGARLEFIDADDLAWGDLSRFDVIVTGVRAYERRQDLRANNDRLLEYADNGGTVIVQYNKFEFNQAQYGPYPAVVSRNRVTDEAAPIRILANDHPVFAWPNPIGPATWDQWVQERGLYFLGERDRRYADLVELEDTFEYNPGLKRGALVEAEPGRGRWIYVGLGLWRQLPAGTTGAYALLANLLSLGTER